MPEKLLKLTLKKFFAIYIGSLIFLFSCLFYFAYNAQKEQLINSETQNVSTYLAQLEEQLKTHHQNKSKEIKIESKGFDIALFDIDKNIIASQIKDEIRWQSSSWIESDKLFMRHDQSVYFLGVKYIFASSAIDTRDIIIKLLTIFIPAFVFMSTIGYFLSRVALKPAKLAFESIDTFVKHATHDINTPISSILSNSHLLLQKNISSENSKIISRLMLGAKSLAILYEDLVFLSFESINKKKTVVKVDELIMQRVGIMEQMAEYKKIAIEMDILPVVLCVSENDIARLIDNLLSNAIKYNKVGGTIKITLNQKYLSIKDSGVGMSEDEKSLIFNRYYRGVSFEKGIGLGMEIIARVCSAYSLKLEIKSEKHNGSEVVIRWSESLDCA